MQKKEGFPRNFEQIRSMVRESLQKHHAERADHWTHVAGGSESGSTWKRSMEAFEGLGFALRAVNDVKKEDVDLSVDALGENWKLPIWIGPMSGIISSVCENTFSEMAAGARAAGIAASVGYPAGPDVHSKMVEEGARVFRIVKPLKDIDKLKESLRNAQEAGCFAAGIDTDSVAGLKSGDTGMFEDICGGLSLDVLKDVRKSVDIPFIIKGVLSVDDVHSALEVGADAIVVSTHCGVSLDYCPSSLEVLPEIVKAVNKRMKVLFDSGIRRGSDIIKALALGADAVLIGRMAIWGLALGKAEGLSWILQLMADEMRRTMALLGAGKLGDLNKGMLLPLNRMGELILSRD